MVSCRFAGAVVVFLALAACTPEQVSEPSITDSTIAVGVADDAPGFSLGSGNPAGFDIDLMHAIGVNLHTPIAPTVISSGDRDGSLMNKTATIVIHTYSITKQRNLDGVDFAGPYLVSPQGLLVRADAKPLRSIADLAGKSVCTVRATTGAEIKIPGANMGTRPAATTDCVKLLKSHKTDAVFNDTLVLYGYTHANPGKYRVELSGSFGELQYYGVGLLGHQHADCLKLNAAISTYLGTQWRHDFLDTLPDAAAAYPGTNSIDGDFETQFKPKDSDMRTLSCKL